MSSTPSGSIDHVHNFGSSKEIMFTCQDGTGKEVNVTINIFTPESAYLGPEMNDRIANGIAMLSGGAIPNETALSQLNTAPSQLERILGNHTAV